MQSSLQQLNHSVVARVPHEHLVQFYQNDDFLAGAVADFVYAGLKSGDGIVIIVTASHQEKIERAFAAKGSDVLSAIPHGQLVCLDASETMSRFMVNGAPDSEKFKQHIAGLIENMNLRYRRVRAFGEMVNLLWQQGNLSAALQLEDLWNDLINSRPAAMTLLCAYTMSGFNELTHGNAFYEICRTHSHVIPTEEYSELKSPEAQRRLIATLQQQALVLQTELASRKNIEKELQEALHIRDEFLSIAGHELRTPLTALKLQTQILQRANEGSAKLKKAVSKIDHQSDRLITLIDQLLDLTRIRSGKLQLELTPVNLGDTMREVVTRLAENTILGERSKSTKSVITIHEPQAIVGQWDKSRIEQVLINLMINAVKYGDGKPIDVTLNLNQDSQTAQIIVKDNGIGINSSDQGRIFKRFERAAAASHFAGLGLGLYIVQQIIDAHSGTVHVESQMGKGSTFTIELPLKTKARIPRLEEPALLT